MRVHVWGHSGYDREAVHVEGRFMGYIRENFEQSEECALAAQGREQRSRMQTVQNLEAVINEGLRVALLEETPDQSLEVLLEHLGKALHGDRTYIFERNPAGGDDNTYEWAAEGVKAEKDNLQNVQIGRAHV